MFLYLTTKYSFQFYYRVKFGFVVFIISLTINCFNIAIVNRVQKRENPPFRPLIPSSYGDGLYVTMMYTCWDENPSLRPKFSEILQTIKQINNGK